MKYVINLKPYPGFTYYQGAETVLHEERYATVGYVSTAKRYDVKRDAQKKLAELQSTCVNAAEARVEEVEL